jgi:hypothetical protein
MRSPHTPPSAAREAFALPLLLLSTALLAGVRIDDDWRYAFVGPTLFSLVLAVMLAGLLMRSGLVAPALLMSPERGALANLNGFAVLSALLFASAQVFTLLTPEGGLLAILFDAFFVAMLWTTAAARPEAPRLVRSLFVVFGWSLVLRFVVLNGLAAPDGSLARRLFAATLEGLTLGALGLTYHAPATGYVAFLALGLFFVALLLLPSAPWSWTLVGAPPLEPPPRQIASRAADGARSLETAEGDRDDEPSPNGSETDIAAARGRGRDPSR